MTPQVIFESFKYKFPEYVDDNMTYSKQNQSTIRILNNKYEMFFYLDSKNSNRWTLDIFPKGIKWGKDAEGR